MDLTEAAEELYSLRPDGFVGRRTTLVAEVKAEGDKRLADQIKRLPKPAAAAWAVNMLVRQDAEQVEQVLSLGAGLRAAQASMQGEELRRLGRQRRQLTAAVTARVRSLAAELGHRLGDPVAAQVEETLHAAMADEDAAAAVRTGLLVKPLAVTGLDGVDLAGSVALPDALGASVVRREPPRLGAEPGSEPGSELSEPKPWPGRPDLTVVPDDTRAVEQAERDLAEAEEALIAAERRLAKAVQKLQKRQAKGLQIHAELEELRRRVAELEQRNDLNEEEVAEAEEQRDSREEAVEERKAAVRAARKALDALG